MNKWNVHYIDLKIVNKKKNDLSLKKIIKNTVKKYIKNFLIC